MPSRSDARQPVGELGLCYGVRSKSASNRVRALACASSRFRRAAGERRGMSSGGSCNGSGWREAEQLRGVSAVPILIGASGSGALSQPPCGRARRRAGAGALLGALPRRRGSPPAMLVLAPLPGLSPRRDYRMSLAGRRRPARTRPAGQTGGVELDAIPPARLCALVRSTIETHPPACHLKALQVAETSEREALRGLTVKAVSVAPVTP